MHTRRFLKRKYHYDVEEFWCGAMSERGVVAHEESVVETLLIDLAE